MTNTYSLEGECEVISQFSLNLLALKQMQDNGTELVIRAYAMTAETTGMAEFTSAQKGDKIAHYGLDVAEKGEDNPEFLLCEMNRIEQANILTFLEAYLGVPVEYEGILNYEFKAK
ncbi:hypothetical protein N9383_03030 [Granulosicoccus sp.]|nr:hypothetical protein [Granulosicoccus sp.]